MALEPSLAAAADQDFPQPRFANVVSTVNLGCKLNLLQIVMKARNPEYTPGRFPAVIMRIREPKTTCLIFSSGKLVITGAKSVQASRMAATRYRNIVKKVGFSEAKFKDFRIQNIVASCDVNFPIRLETLNLTGGDSKYEPEIFPGLIYKVLKPSVVFLIFASGKVVITGAKNFENETLKAWDLMCPLIALHRRAVVPRAIVQPKITATKTGKNKCS